MYNDQSRRSRRGISLAARERIFLLSSCASWVALVVVHGQPAKAATTNLIKDPYFDQITATTGGPTVWATLGAVAGGTTVTGSFPYGTTVPNSFSLVGWYSAGYNYLWLDASGTGNPTLVPVGVGLTQSLTTTGSSPLALWSTLISGHTSINTFGAAYSANGVVYNFIGNDADYEVGATQQTITGLVAGTPAVLTFAWAAAQQSGFSGTLSENWIVSLGGTTYYAPTISLASESFSGWYTQTYTFYPTATSEVLSFLASGSIQLPPFMLMADPSLTQNVPEPASIAGLFTGIMGMLGLGRLRRRTAKGAKANS